MNDLLSTFRRRARVPTGRLVCDRTAVPRRRAAGCLFAGSLAVTLAACGGGGSDGADAGAATAAPVATPPTITSQPASAVVVAPAPVTFSVVTNGSEPHTFQWLRNGTPIAGATAASYTTPATVEADSGTAFTVSVSNGAGSVVSTAATLTVTPSSGGSTPSDSYARCATAFPADKTLEITIEITGSADRFVSRFHSNGAAVFDGHATTEYEIVGQYESGFGAVVSQKLYIDVDRATGRETQWGEATTATTLGSDVLLGTTSNRPPYVIPALAAGQTVTIADIGTSTTQIVHDGVTSPATSTDFSGNDVVTYLGMETITVPAGTFLTCKVRTRFADATSDQDDWVLVDYGWPVKTVTRDEIRVATKVLLDGVPLP